VSDRGALRNARRGFRWPNGRLVPIALGGEKYRYGCWVGICVDSELAYPNQQ